MVTTITSGIYEATSSNRGFERGNADHWTTQGTGTTLTVQTSTSSRSGACYAVVNSSAGGGILMATTSSSVTPAVLHTVSAWVRNSTSTSVITLTVQEIGGGDTISQSKSMTVVSGAGWRLITFTYQKQRSGSTLRPVITQDTAGNFHVDDVSIAYAIVVPDQMDGYRGARPAKSVVHQVLGASAPDVILRPAGMRVGSLRLVLATEAQVRQALDHLARTWVFTLLTDERDFLSMQFVIPEGRDIGVELDNATRGVWILDVPYQEVAWA